MDQIIEAFMNNPAYINNRPLFILISGLLFLMVLMWIVVAIQHYILKSFEKKKREVINKSFEDTQ
jgi:hypothetical protein